MFNSFNFRLEDDDSEGSDAFEDEDEEDGPALVCSCTLGGPTVVIEAKKDKVQEGREGVTTKQDSGKGPYQEEDGRGSETEHPCSDAQVVRFEVTEVLISFYPPSHPHQFVTIPEI